VPRTAACASFRPRATSSERRTIGEIVARTRRTYCPRLDSAHGLPTGSESALGKTPARCPKENSKEGLDDRLWGQVLGTGAGVPGVGEGAWRTGCERRRKRPRSRDYEAGSRFHGDTPALPKPRCKEGVDGSSPSEGLHKSPANGHIVLPVMARSGRFAGTRRVHSGTGGHSRARASSCDTRHGISAELYPCPYAHTVPANAPSGLPTLAPRCCEYGAVDRAFTSRGSLLRGGSMFRRYTSLGGRRGSLLLRGGERWGTEQLDRR
jgi:hypothetical protein